MGFCFSLVFRFRVFLDLWEDFKSGSELFGFRVG